MSRARTKLEGVIVLDAVNADGWSDPIDVRDYRQIVATVSTANSAQGVIKPAGAINPTSPTFTSAAAVDNEWGYLAFYNLDNANKFNGSTGAIYEGTDGVALLILNTEYISWLAFELDNYAAGNFTVKVSACDNG